MLMKETRPFAFYLSISSALLAASFTFMTPVLIDYIQTGLVPKMPTWILSMVLLMMAAMTFTAGLILDSLARSRAELLRIHYMDLPALSTTRNTQAAIALFQEPEKSSKPAVKRTKAA